MNGRYGPYLVYDGKNYRLPKSMHAKASELTLEECMEIVIKEKSAACKQKAISKTAKMLRIILIGYMGAGKTTVGKALAKELGIPFYDLDWYIESRMRKKVSQIFAEKGEEGFRKIEHNMLHEVAEFENVVISCGGGTPCFFDNMDYMNQQAEQ